MNPKTIRIGCGAGYSGDRIEPAVELAEQGDIRYLVFECLAERTIAIAQRARLDDPTTGYDPMLAERMRAVLRPCHARKIKIISNMGAANPVAGAARIAEVARALGIRGLKIAAISGDDVLAALKISDTPLAETGLPVSTLGDRLVSANAYLGAQPIVDALRNGAEFARALTEVESAAYYDALKLRYKVDRSAAVTAAASATSATVN